MNLRETKELLARVAAVDNRELSEAMAEQWQELIGDLNFKVAKRALKLAQRDQKVQWVQPKDIVAKMHDAIAELNREVQSEKSEEQEEWVPCPKPSNYDQMVSFYRELYQKAPWATEKATGMLTVGTTHSKPQPHHRQLYNLELDREVEKSAEAVGWTIPQPEWN
jgi:sugar-specific transcriptional regulator TrmB